ncbi:MAG TPA: glycerol-3-phosphate 1-O-acyltransferase PlsY [Clostridiales bacterium]|nr:glycerol-3-phosphate 1-O-acyltransferase PlsY [Clostridiales bacterium]
MMVLAVLIVSVALLSYILGSISFAVIFSKLFVKKDVRDYGSGNAGMTNVVRVAGVIPGLLTLLFDVLKGVIAVLLARDLVFDYLFRTSEYAFLHPVYGAYLCGVCCLLGHFFPVFFRFRGGKGVATAAGIMLVIDWRVLACALTVFLIAFLITKIISIGSILAASSLPLFAFVFFDANSGTNRVAVVLLAALLGAIVVAKHKDNIKRIIKGEEKPITSKRRD